MRGLNTLNEQNQEFITAKSAKYNTGVLISP